MLSATLDGRAARARALQDSVTISRTPTKLRRAQELLRHGIPTRQPRIIDRALTLLVGDLERAKAATVEHPRAARSAAAGSRHIPAVVRRAVWRRDQGRCAFGTQGRCVERGFLEFHHVQPHTAGVPQASRTSNSAVVRTTSTKPNSTSIRDCRCSRGRWRVPTRSRPSARPSGRHTLLGRTHAPWGRPSRPLAHRIAWRSDVGDILGELASSVIGDLLSPSTDRGRVRFNWVLSVIAAAVQVWTFTTVHNPLEGRMGIWVDDAETLR